MSERAEPKFDSGSDEVGRHWHTLSIQHHSSAKAHIGVIYEELERSLSISDVVVPKFMYSQGKLRHCIASSGSHVFHDSILYRGSTPQLLCNLTGRRDPQYSMMEGRGFGRIGDGKLMNVATMRGRSWLRLTRDGGYPKSY